MIYAIGDDTDAWLRWAAKNLPGDVAERLAQLCQATLVAHLCPETIDMILQRAELLGVEERVAHALAAWDPKAAREYQAALKALEKARAAARECLRAVPGISIERPTATSGQVVDRLVSSGRLLRQTVRDNTAMRRRYNKLCADGPPSS